MQPRLQVLRPFCRNSVISQTLCKYYSNVKGSVSTFATCTHSSLFQQFHKKDKREELIDDSYLKFLSMVIRTVIRVSWKIAILVSALDTRSVSILLLFRYSLLLIQLGLHYRTFVAITMSLRTEL